MGLEYAAAIVQVIDLSLRLSLKIATFVQETKDSNETRSDLYHQIKTFLDTIQSVQRTFSQREEQRNRRPLNKAEGEICKAVTNILVRCEGYMERFERKIKGLGGQFVEAGWLNRALLQLSLQVKGPAISKLERQITASISSLETLLACFQPFMDQELYDGIETNHRYLRDILHRIEHLDRLLVQLEESSRQAQRLLAAEAGADLQESHIQDRTVAQAVVRELCDPNDGSCELVDETLSAARLFLERISESGTVAGLSAASEGQSQPDDSVQADSTGQSEYNTQTPNEGDGGVRLLGCCHPEHEMEEVFKSVDSVDIMTDHIDNCISLAENAMENGNFAQAEKNISAAIEIGEQREHIWKFPFQESFECRELLAFSMTQIHKFLEAERIYTALLKSQKVRSSPETRGRVYFSFAQFYRNCYDNKSTGTAQENLFERCEHFGRLSYQLAESLAVQGKDSSDSSWPKGHPTLGQAAELLEDLYESWGKQGLALTYRQRKGSHSENTSPILIAATTPRGPIALPPTPPETEPPVSLTKSVGSSRSAFSGSNTSPSPATSCRLTVPIKKRDFEMTKWVLDFYSDSIDMEQLDEDKHLTPLLLAASKKDTRIVRVLLEQANGPNIKARDSNGWTVLHHALLGGGGGDVVELLIRAGADVKAITTDGRRMSALHFAARENNLVAAKALLDNDADINATDEVGRTSLWLAVMRKQYNMCRLLLQRHAAFDRPKIVKAYPKIENVFCEMEMKGALKYSSPLSPTGSRQSTTRNISTKSHGHVHPNRH